MVHGARHKMKVAGKTNGRVRRALARGRVLRCILGPVKSHQLCPKCHSTNIVRVPGKAGGFGSGNNISVGATILSAVLVTRYVCTSCGFVEEWVDQPEDLGELAAKFAGRSTPQR